MNRAAAAKTLSCLLGLLAGCSAAQVVVAPPPPPPPPQQAQWPARPESQPLAEVAFPTAERRSSTGKAIEVVTVTRRDQPLVHLRWVIPGGRAIETAQGLQRWPEGSLQIAASLAMQGTRNYPRTMLAQTLADLGAAVHVQVLGDALWIEATAPSAKTDALLLVLRDVLREPSFDKKEFAAMQARYTAALQDELGDPAALAARLALRISFGAAHPYGQQGPTLTSLPKVTLAHIQQAWRSATQLGGSTVIASGDIDSAALATALDRTFGAVSGSNPWPTLPLPQPATADTCHVIDLPAATQAVVVQVAPGRPRRDPMWPQLIVANQILGGSASSRLFMDLREKRGLTYGVYSGVEGRRQSGRWSLTASVAPERVGEALAAIEDQILRARRELPAAAELADAQRFLIGQFALQVANTSDVADFLGVQTVYGLDGGAWSEWAAALHRVSAEQALEATVQSVPLRGRNTVVAGPLAAMRPALDGACSRIVQYGSDGVARVVLFGSDNEMTESQWASAFALWAQGGGGTAAAARFVADHRRDARLRARALAAVVRGPDWQQAHAMGRAAGDWRTTLAPAVASLLRSALGDREVAVQKRAHAVLLAMTARGAAEPDVAAAEATQLREAVAAWAFAGMDAATPAEEIQRLATARLDPGDLDQLGDAAGAVLEHWIAADAMRLEAAAALAKAATPAARMAMVQGYRRLLARGVAADSRDLALLTAQGGVETLVLLLDSHALVQGNDDAAAVRQTAALMKAVRQLAARLDGEPAPRGEDGAPLARSLLAAHVAKIEAHLENLLRMRNADDRWYAAALLIRFRGGVGLRHVLENLPDDDYYRQPRWHTADGKRAIAELAKDQIAPLGQGVVPTLLAALAERNPMGKIVAVAGLKAIGGDGALQALATCTDETDATRYLELAGAVTVREIALAAVDVHRFYAELSTAVQLQQLTPQRAARYRTIAALTTDLSGRRLRSEVTRLAAQQEAEAEVPMGLAPAATSVEDLP